MIGTPALTVSDSVSRGTDHQQYLARPGSRPYCTAQPLMISMPPFRSWAPVELRFNAEHTPRCSEAFWEKHKPTEHCALRTPNEQIRWE